MVRPLNVPITYSRTSTSYAGDNSVFSAGDYGGQGQQTAISLPNGWRDVVLDLLNSFSKGLAAQGNGPANNGDGSSDGDDGVNKNKESATSQNRRGGGNEPPHSDGADATKKRKGARRFFRQMIAMMLFLSLG